MARVSRRESRRRIHRRIRRKVRGVADRPRLAVFRSLRHFYAQVIDDAAGRTIVAASSREVGVTDGGNRRGAAAVGRRLAERARAAGVGTVVFDRGGVKYHGRVKAFADAVRKEGIRC